MLHSSERGSFWNGSSPLEMPRDPCRLMTNDEIRIIAQKFSDTFSSFEHSGFLRHSSFVIPRVSVGLTGKMPVLQSAGGVRECDILDNHRGWLVNCIRDRLSNID